MGNNIKRTKPVRKATFSVKLKRGVRVFTPVNKRAKRYARGLGKRKLNANDLRTINANGSRAYVYTSTGTLTRAVL
jgi:hypothetical protein